MKKFITITILLFCSLYSSHTFSQGIPVYPIPSYNVEVNGYVNFSETLTVNRLMQPTGKRDVDVQVKTPSSGKTGQVRVWVYKLDHSTALGPYTVTSDTPLEVAIDFSAWGVLVLSDEAVFVDVWTN